MSGSPALLGSLLYGACWFVLLVAVLRFCLAVIRRELRLRWSDSQFPPLAAAAITAILFAFQPPDYRILQDEAVLTSTSLLMAKAGTANAIYQTRLEGASLIPVTTSLDKRPPLFPFLVHLLHRAFGYSVKNPFYMNAAICFALLTLLIRLMAPFGLPIAAAGALFAAAQPSFFLSATSAGFDLCSAFLFLVSVLSCARARRVREASSFTLACALLALFSLTRYESILPAALLLGWMIGRPAHWSGRNLGRELPWIAALAFGLVPLALLYRWMWNPDLHEAGVVFAARYFAEHGLVLAKSLVWYPAPLPQLGPLTLFASASALYLFRTVPRKERGEWRGPIFAVGAGLLLTLAHFFGDFSRTDAQRLFMPFLIALSLSPALAAGLLARRWPAGRWAFAGASLVLAIFAFGYGLTARKAEELFADVGATRAYRESRNFLAEHDPAGTIVISRFPTNFAILGFASLDFDSLRGNQALLAAAARAGKNVVIFQNVEAASGLPLMGEEIPASLRSVKLGETKISARTLLRTWRL